MNARPLPSETEVTFILAQLMHASMVAQACQQAEARSDYHTARAREVVAEMQRLPEESEEFLQTWQAWAPRGATLARVVGSTGFRRLLAEHQAMRGPLDAFLREHEALVAPDMIRRLQAFYGWILDTEAQGRAFLGALERDLREHADEQASVAEEWSTADAPLEGVMPC